MLLPLKRATSGVLRGVRGLTLCLRCPSGNRRRSAQCRGHLLDSSRARCLALFSPRKGAWRRSHRILGRLITCHRRGRSPSIDPLATPPMVRRSEASQREATQKAGAQGRHGRANHLQRPREGINPSPTKTSRNDFVQDCPPVSMLSGAPLHEVRHPQLHPSPTLKCDVCDVFAMALRALCVLGVSIAMNSSRLCVFALAATASPQPAPTRLNPSQAKPMERSIPTALRYMSRATSM